MEMTREERLTAAAIIMRDAVEEMLAHDATASGSTTRVASHASRSTE